MFNRHNNSNRCIAPVYILLIIQLLQSPVIPTRRDLNELLKSTNHEIVLEKDRLHDPRETRDTNARVEASNG